jgi:uncharacterized membrane protein
MQLKSQAIKILQKLRSNSQKSLSSIADFILKNKFISVFLGLYFVSITLIVLKAYFGFAMYVWDYGVEHQVMHNTAYGRIMQSSYEVDNYLGDHFSPIVILFAPIYRIFPFGFTPLIFQNICMVASLIAIYLIAKKRLNSDLLASFITVLFSIYPAVQGAIFFHYHPGTLAMPFFIWGIWALIEKEKFRLGFALLAVASLAREEFGFSVGMVGLYYFLISKKKESLLIFAYGFLTSIVAIKYIQPIFRPLEDNDSLARYSHLGKDLWDILLSPIKRPKEWLKMFTDRSRFDYIIRLFQIFAFTPFLSGSIIIIAPLVLLNLISTTDLQRSGSFHYDTIIALGIVYSFILSLEKIINWLNNYFNNSEEIKKSELKYLKPLTSKINGLLIILLILPFGFAGLISNNSIVPGILAKPGNFAILQDLEKLKKEIPQNAEVAVDGKTGGYFAEFPNTHYFPNCCGKTLDLNLVEYYVVYKPKVEWSDNNPQFFIDNADKVELLKETEFFKVYKRK